MLSLSDILSWALIAIAALIPIVGWGYLFSYASGDPLSARRFAGGILTGALAAGIIFALDRAFAGALAPFHPYNAPAMQTAFPWQFLLGATSAGLALIALAALIASGLARDPLPGLTLAAKTAPAIPLFALVLTLARWGLESAPAWNLASPITGAHGVTYASLTLAFAYYLAVAAVEEISKLGQALPGFPGARDVRDAVLTALFVALGFAFLENILYVQSQWTQGGNALSTLAFRSIFSTFLHVGTATVAATWLLRDFRFLKLVPNVVIGLALAILLHGAFNAGTGAGWGWIPFAYLAAGYLIAGKVFYQEDTINDLAQYPSDPALPQPA